MSVQARIDEYIATQPEPKRGELRDLHRLITSLSPDCGLSFLDGRDGEGRIVTNPNIGYGSQVLTYASGETRAFYRVGLSGNTSGISVYVMGLADKKYLAETYGARLGKAKVTGYCIKFRSTKDVDMVVLGEIIAGAMGGTLDGGAR